MYNTLSDWVFLFAAIWKTVPHSINKTPSIGKLQHTCRFISNLKSKLPCNALLSLNVSKQYEFTQHPFFRIHLMNTGKRNLVVADKSTSIKPSCSVAYPRASCLQGVNVHASGFATQQIIKQRIITVER